MYVSKDSMGWMKKFWMGNQTGLEKEYITFGEIFFTGNLCVASLLLALFSLDFFFISTL